MIDWTIVKQVDVLSHFIHYNFFKLLILAREVANYILMKPSLQLFRYGSVHQSPVNRISLAKISQCVEYHQISHQLFNNLTIAYNCTKIALKYSKCYCCRLPLIRSSLRLLYGMGFHDAILTRVDHLFLNQCPSHYLRPLLKRFKYENKHTFAALSLVRTQTLNPQDHQTAVKFLAAIELVNLGFSLHFSIGKPQRLNFVTRLALRVMSKQIKDSYLVLSGDYFHIKGSVLAADTNNIELSRLLSELEIDFCKYVHLVEQLKKKVLTEGYHQVGIQQIYNISILKISPVVKGLTAMSLISSTHPPNRQEELYELIGLLMLYCKDLENFMFSFKGILKKYGQYMANRINFDNEESLPYYIFFYGAQNNKRLDTAYLNTVKLMYEEIEYLRRKLQEMLGEAEAKEIQRKLNYHLMIYS